MSFCLCATRYICDLHSPITEQKLRKQLAAETQRADALLKEATAQGFSLDCKQTGKANACKYCRACVVKERDELAAKLVEATKDRDSWRDNYASMRNTWRIDSAEIAALKEKLAKVQRELENERSFNTQAKRDVEAHHRVVLGMATTRYESAEVALSEARGKIQSLISLLPKRARYAVNEWLARTAPAQPVSARESAERLGCLPTKEQQDANLQANTGGHCGGANSWQEPAPNFGTKAPEPKAQITPERLKEMLAKEPAPLAPAILNVLGQGGSTFLPAPKCSTPCQCSRRANPCPDCDAPVKLAAPKECRGCYNTGRKIVDQGIEGDVIEIKCPDCQPKVCKTCAHFCRSPDVGRCPSCEEKFQQGYRVRACPWCPDCKGTGNAKESTESESNKRGYVGADGEPETSLGSSPSSPIIDPWRAAREFDQLPELEPGGEEGKSE